MVSSFRTISLTVGLAGAIAATLVACTLEPSGTASVFEGSAKDAGSDARDGASDGDADAHF